MWSLRWRQLAVGRALIIGGTLGLVSPVVSLFVAAFLTPSAPWRSRSRT